jgi:hypothetical protein
LPQMVGVGLALLLALLFLILLITRKWAIGTTPTTPTTPKTGGKHHHGVHHKAVEQGRVYVKTKTPIQKSVVMAHCGRKELGK